MEKSIRYLIPWDFTPVAENALKYAIKIASASQQDVQIELVHVLITSGALSKNRLSDDEVKQKLDDDVARIKSQYGVNVVTEILTGKLFDAISTYASESEATLVFMGTHGIKGVQKLTGSWALKIIAGSDVPFIVVQDEPSTEKVFQNVVMPLSFRDEHKEKVLHTIKFARQFGSKINIITPNTSDSGVQKKINLNLTFAKHRFEEAMIPFEVHSASKGRPFHEEVVSLAADIEADLIIIITTPNLDFTDFVFGAQEQYIIANDQKIAVMCINPGAVQL